MDPLDELAEQRIAQAIDSGEMNNLPGSGRPIDLDDNSQVPETLRVAYRVLKNAGYSPPEVSVYSQIREVETLISCLDPGQSKTDAMKKLSLLRTKLGSVRGEYLQPCSSFYSELAEKLDNNSDNK